MAASAKLTTIAQWITYARTELMLTKTAVGRELGGLTLRTVGRWETGETTPSEAHRRLFVELVARRAFPETAEVATALGVAWDAPKPQSAQTDVAPDPVAARDAFDAALRIVADELDITASRVRPIARDLFLRMRASGVSVAAAYAWLDEAAKK